MCKVYGYARISRKEQNIDRQLRNIKAAYPDAIMVQEAYTGTRFDGRVQFEKLLKSVKSGDTIVFDSVSRMSRNAAAKEAKRGVKTGNRMAGSKGESGTSRRRQQRRK